MNSKSEGQSVIVVVSTQPSWVIISCVSRPECPFSIMCTRCNNSQSINSYSLPYFLQTHLYWSIFIQCLRQLHWAGATVVTKRMTRANLPVWTAYNPTLGTGSANYLHYIQHLTEMPGEIHQWRKHMWEKLFIAKKLGCGNGLRRSIRCPFRIPQELQNRSWNLRCTGLMS